jgi:hypothetical protein
VLIACAQARNASYRLCFFSRAASEFVNARFVLRARRAYWFTWLTLVLWVVTIIFWLTRMDMAIARFSGPFIIPTLQVSYAG